jgi:adenylate cyclase
MVGNVGTHARLRYGAVGDVINTASRLVGVNKRIGTRIAVSSDTAQFCRRHQFRPVGEFVLMGRQGPLVVVTPSSPGCGRTQELERYNEAYQALKVGSADAQEKFESLRRDSPADPCIALHLSRLAVGESGVRIRMEEK